MAELEEFVKIYNVKEIHTVTYHDCPAIGAFQDKVVKKEKFGPFTLEQANKKRKERIEYWLDHASELRAPYEFISKLVKEGEYGLRNEGYSYHIGLGLEEIFVPKEKVVSVEEDAVILRNTNG